MCAVFAFTAVLFSACAQQSKKQVSEKPPAEEQPSAEFKKIDAVLSKMSDRAQKEIVISDKAEFLKDLEIVLAEEKKYTQDDLPLYFLIDKKHYAPENYAPAHLKKLEKNSLYNINRSDLSLRTDAEENLRILAQAAKEDGITLLVSSTYRSYEYQKNLFQRWVNTIGLEEAEACSARPGTSQHQLGSAIDFGSITDDFIDTSQGKWLFNNAYKYGWSLSFPKGYTDVTGYIYECWHYRFIGVPACKFQKKYFNNIQQYMLEFIDLWKNS